MIDLSKLTSKEIFDLLRACKSGTDSVNGISWSQLRDELDIRNAIAFLKDLGYPVDEKAILRNRWTGREETIEEIVDWKLDCDGYDVHYASEVPKDEAMYFETYLDALQHWYFSILENWEVPAGFNSVPFATEAHKFGNKSLAEFM